MKILNPHNADVEAGNGNGNGSGDASPNDKGDIIDSLIKDAADATSAAFHDEEEGLDNAKEEPEDKGFSELPGTVDVEANSSNDPLLKAADAEGVRFDKDSRISEEKPRVAGTAIEKRHKEAFIDAILTGGRYKESFSLMGGKVRLVVRSRSTAETDAIIAYSRRMIATDKVKTDYEYSSLMRRLLASVQVDELNGVRYPELEKPFFFEETEKGLTPPAWESRLDIWGGKPEAVVSLVTRCILEFEARYWEMIRHVDDMGFWAPEESTGK